MKRKNNMNTAKLGVIFIVAVMALAGIGASYAAWFDIIYVEGTVSTGSVKWEVIDKSETHIWKIHGLSEPYNPDWGNEIYVDYEMLSEAEIQDMFPGLVIEEISSSTVTISEDKHTVTVTYDNLFPCIWFKTDIAIKYLGTVPGKINDIFYEPTGGVDWIAPLIESHDIYATARDADGDVVELGYQLHENDLIYIELWVHIPQNNDLMILSGGFTASFEVIQWNEYVPPQPPVANANGPYSAFNAITITLDGSGSYDPDGTIVLYEWDFDNDGTYDWSSASSGVIEHIYSTEGVYTANLRVTDNEGYTNTDTTTVTISGFSDNFNDNNLDTTKWTMDVVGTGNSFQETNQEAQFVTYGHSGWANGHSILWSKDITIENWDTITFSGKWKFTNPNTAEMRFFIYDADDTTKYNAITYATWTSYPHEHIRYYYGGSNVEYVDRAIPRSYVTFEIVISKTSMQYWENGVKLREISTTTLSGTTQFRLQIGGWDYSAGYQYMFFDDIAVTASG